MRFTVLMILMTLPPLVLSSCATTSRQCPDGSPAYFERNCHKLFPLTASEHAAAAQAQLKKTNLLTAGVGVVYATKVRQLADQISDSTIRLQSTFTTFCGLANRNPCDTVITSKLIDRTSEIALKFADVEEESKKASAALAATSDPKQQEAIVEKTHATISTILEQLDEFADVMDAEAKTNQ